MRKGYVNIEAENIAKNRKVKEPKESNNFSVRKKLADHTVNQNNK